MSRVIVVTDSNSGITQSEAKELGVVVMPMPFYINGQMFYGVPHITTALATMLGFLLLAMSYISFGMLASSITENLHAAGWRCDR